MVGVKEKVEDTLIISANDERKYRGLKLENGMQVMLISDPKTDKAAAALDVNVGFMYDPKELPGLAHFCEHMLFLGTEKFPSENDYNKYISEHGGMNNAFTTLDHTTYYFDVAHTHFAEALDRFSQFFMAPLFTESMSEREVHAIHSEHEKNIPNDTWRIDQFDKSTSSADHDYNRFGTGTLDTLLTNPKANGINTRDAVMKFHQQWYSSNIMTLAMLGRESLDELEDLCIKYFHPVTNKSIEVKKWTEHPFGPDQLQLKAYIVPVKDLRSLIITFPFPDLRDQFESKPDQYLSHLLGHEGSGSLLSALRRRGWCNSLVAGCRSGAKGFSFFSVNVDLTEEGIEHIDDIVTLVFQYIKLLKKEGPQKWIHDENELLAKMHFQFKDKESPRNYVTSIVSFLHRYPLNQTLSGAYLSPKWDPDQIEHILGHLCPSKVRIIVVGKKFENVASETEKWYEIKYKLEKIPTEQIKAWESVDLCDELQLPEKNDLIATDFDVLPSSDSVSQFPQVVRKEDLMRVWHKQDDEFLLPKAIVTFEFMSPLAYLDPASANKTHLFVCLFKDALTEFSYTAELAGLKWEMGNTKYGIVLSIGGYNHKQEAFLDEIMQRLVSLKIDKQRFEILKENHIRKLKNFKAEQPYQHAEYYLSALLSEQQWIKEELLAATDFLTVESLEKFIPQFFSNLYIECLVHGNVLEKTALNMSSIVEKHLKQYEPI